MNEFKEIAACMEMLKDARMHLQILVKDWYWCSMQNMSDEERKARVADLQKRTRAYIWPEKGNDHA